MSRQVASLLQHVTARGAQTVEVKEFYASVGHWTPAPNQPDPLPQIQQMVARGWSVPVLTSINPNQPYGHYEMVEAIDARGVTVLNPWGYRETMTLDAFRQKLVAAFFQ